MKFHLVTIIFLFYGSLNAQKVINVRYALTANEVEIIPGHSEVGLVPGYTVWIPKGRETKGMIVLPFQRRDSIQKNNLIKYALKDNIAVMYVSTENPIEFLFKERQTQSIAEDVLKVCENFKIPKNSLLFMGYSLAGTRALKLAIFTMQNEAFKDIKPRAIAISDAPLDMNRLYRYNDALIGPLTRDQSKLIKAYLIHELDGNPTNSKARYNSVSPYTKNVRNGGNAPYFSDIPFRAYVRNNINWASEHLGQCDYDLSEFVNQLETLGNNHASKIEVKPTDKENTAWSGINERDLVSWFSQLINN